LIQSPPVHNSKPTEFQNSVKIGSFMVNLSKGLDQVSDNGYVPGILKFSNSFSSLELLEEQPDQCSSSPCKGTFSQASIPCSKINWPPPCFEVINRTRRLRGCTRCLGLNHSRASCRAQFRCAACFNYGHKFKFCLTRSRPVIAWKPKVVPQSERPTSECERATSTEAQPESQRAGGNSIPPPNSSGATENPTSASIAAA
jgi:hypothetical protein